MTLRMLRYTNPATGRTCCAAATPELLCSACRARHDAHEQPVARTAAPFPPTVAAQTTGVPKPPSLIESVRNNSLQPQKPTSVVVLQANGVPAPPKLVEVLRSNRKEK